MFEPKREVVVGGWRRLHSEEHCNFYEGEMGGVCRTHGKDDKCV